MWVVSLRRRIQDEASSWGEARILATGPVTHSRPFEGTVVRARFRTRMTFLSQPDYSIPDIKKGPQQMLGPKGPRGKQEMVAMIRAVAQLIQVLVQCA